MSAQIIDFDFTVAQSLGLHVEHVREAKPLLHELGLRIGALLKDVAAAHDPPREVFALAQAMSAAVILQTAAQVMEEDEESFYFRLIEAADRGLFDLEMTDASPALKALYNQFLGDNDE